MADYWVDDGGNGTTGASWATAYTTLANLVTAVPAALTTSGNRVFIGHDTTQTQASALTVTGPSSGNPVILISCDRTDTGAVPAYLKSTTNQIETTGTNGITLDGSFAVYGIRFHCGSNFLCGNDANEVGFYKNCTFALGPNGQLGPGGGQATKVHLVNPVLDLTDDGATPRAASPIANSYNSSWYVSGATSVNAANRTGSIFGTIGGMFISGCDFSGFTAVTTCEVVDYSSNYGYVTNCLTAATWTAINAAGTSTEPNIMFTNVGPADSPTYLLYDDTTGRIVSTSSIYRTGGATIESDAVSWLVTTNATCAEGHPLFSPYIYGTTTNGTKTFDLYITNDTADFTDAQVWLEVDYLSTTDEAIWALASDQRTITATAAAQTDDVTSTWNGSGPAFTYKQKLSVSSVSVGESGQYRARVCVGVASIASSRYFYIDPKVTVS